MTDPPGRASSRLSFAWGHFRRTKVPPGLQSLRKGKLLSKDLVSDGFWLSHTKPSCAQVREPWPGAANRTLLAKHYLCLELERCLSSQSTPSSQGWWGSFWAPREEENAGGSNLSQGQLCPQLCPITARLMVFALIKAPGPGAPSILKTKVLCMLRKSLRICLVEDKTKKNLKGEVNESFIYS